MEPLQWEGKGFESQGTERNEWKKRNLKMKARWTFRVDEMKEPPALAGCTIPVLT
jgi:hypothetical protein